MISPGRREVSVAMICVGARSVFGGENLVASELVKNITSLGQIQVGPSVGRSFRAN